ncbi:MAG TPA: GAF domain-containing protein, partial [Gemmatimonadales bacterium]|nr:GAF domain-containing protein [Gemmatimonadales bacterium]
MAAVAALAAVVSIIAVILTTDALPRLPATLLLVFAVALVAASLGLRQWEIPLQLLSTVLLVVIAWWAEERIWWISLFALFSVLATFSVALLRARKRAGDAEVKADQLAVQVDRRISELFSLQELSYVLSESIQLDRVVDQVAKYAARFLQADGAIVVVVETDGKLLQVVAGSGTLESMVGQVSADSESALVRFAIGRDRIEVAQGEDTPTVDLIGGVLVRSAAVAPLRAQGITMGALAVADRRGGPFTTEDLWLLSTVATNASVVLANSRL